MPDAGFICNAFAVTFTSVFWKLYGQAPDGAHITNDTFLARVGAVASLFNGLSRMAWGHLGDRHASLVPSAAFGHELASLAFWIIPQRRPSLLVTAQYTIGTQVQLRFTETVLVFRYVTRATKQFHVD
jgi:hypothetical protein